MPVVIDKILRAGEGKLLRKLKKIADQVNSIEEDFVEMSDAELREHRFAFAVPPCAWNSLKSEHCLAVRATWSGSASSAAFRHRRLLAGRLMQTAMCSSPGNFAAPCRARPMRVASMRS